MKFRFEIQGTDGAQRQWTTRCSEYAAANMDDALDRARRMSFEQLTGGHATFNKPGEGGCRGPYKIIKVLVEQVWCDHYEEYLRSLDYVALLMQFAEQQLVAKPTRVNLVAKMVPA